MAGDSGVLAPAYSIGAGAEADCDKLAAGAAAWLVTAFARRLRRLTLRLGPEYAHTSQCAD
jgi:hypothetical protein